MLLFIQIYCELLALVVITLSTANGYVLRTHRASPGTLDDPRDIEGCYSDCNATKTECNARCDGDEVCLEMECPTEHQFCEYFCDVFFNSEDESTSEDEIDDASENTESSTDVTMPPDDDESETESVDRILSARPGQQQQLVSEEEDLDELQSGSQRVPLYSSNHGTSESAAISQQSPEPTPTDRNQNTDIIVNQGKNQDSGELLTTQAQQNASGVAPTLEGTGINLSTDYSDAPRDELTNNMADQPDEQPNEQPGINEMQGRTVSGEDYSELDLDGQAEEEASSTASQTGTTAASNTQAAIRPNGATDSTAKTYGNTDEEDGTFDEASAEERTEAEQEESDELRHKLSSDLRTLAMLFRTNFDSYYNQQNHGFTGRGLPGTHPELGEV